MTEHDNELGILAVLLEQFYNQRLPAAQRLLERMKKGEQLTSWDISFLSEAMNDCHSVQFMVTKHPSATAAWQEATHLYEEIISLAAQNENGAGSGKPIC